MDPLNEIQRALGRIEGRIERVEGGINEIREISERVRALEIWQYWLRGGWAALVAVHLYLCRQVLRITHIF
jgi:hypothetical protein